ncbi:ABC-type transport auxiliary lipoprotein family protein [Pseudomonas benzenivorans]|uniref:ABC-type transport auxiliary lipoprotein family protein n=1 Tax=Pseudomonas benzenivorans TaxID=556533 RepID=A0ABZ0PWU7_9PSED|nr:ABC-type transport auxiliary lipoprotein family protein [Pseudomonas benzenivorans]WPC05652.1 ABC-type transport auxiliary lipoprotein family protein [Pseudomonas benzenivorans]
MTVVRFPLTLLLTGLLGLAGCTAYQPVPLYQLDGGNAELPADKEGVAVLLGPVSIADYLQREALLQRQLDGSLTTASDARWAGSLAADIDRQLLRQLAARLNSQRLAVAPATPGFSPQVQVLLAITRLDSGPQRPAVLEAHWRLLSGEGKLLDGRLVRLEEAHQGSIADQVRAQSLVMRQLVEQVASAVQEYGNAAPAIAKEPRKKAPAAPAAKPVPPSLPAPIRMEGEVFRF